MSFLYHIRPRNFCPGQVAKLIEFRIDKLGIDLQRDQLTTSRPYPNKNYRVGRRKIGRRPVDGIFLVLPKAMLELRVCMTWDINDGVWTATHDVTYTLLDFDFKAASDDMTKWYAANDMSGTEKYKNRFPAWTKWGTDEFIPPAVGAPKMEVFPKQLLDGDEFDTNHGFLLKRTQIFKLPTIERERIIERVYSSKLSWPMPSLDEAITV